MAFVLDDVMLEKLKCGECKKYLSVLPVKVYKNGVTKCGRCCEKDDEGTVSLYEKLAVNYLFKCVNRYEGCNKLLMPSEVMDHEKVCTGGSYKCPKCENHYSGSAYELLQHYTLCHPESILNKNVFYVQLKKYLRETERYLYIKNNMIFLIFIENLSYENIVYLSVVSLKEYDNVEQQFFIKFLGKPDKRRHPETKIKPCTSLGFFKCDYFEINVDHLYANKLQCTFNIILPVMLDIYEVPILSKKLENKDLSTVSQYTQTAPMEKIMSTQLTQTIAVEEMPSVQLTDDFKTNYPGFQLTPCGTALYKNSGERIELTCSNCGQFTGCNVFSCKSKKHITCWECRAWCGICFDQMDGFNADISSVNELLLLPCTWKCGKNFPGDILWGHQAVCKTPIKCCPICGYKMDIPTLLKHLCVAHYNFEHFNPLKLQGYFASSKQLLREVYFMKLKTLFKMTCILEKNSYRISIKTYETYTHFFEMAVIRNDRYYDELLNDMLVSPKDNPKLYFKWARNSKWVCF